MGSKEDRRRKRKQKEAQQDRKRELLRAPFVEGKSSYATAWRQARELAMKAHPSLMLITEFDPGAVDDEEQSLVEHYGLSHLRRIFFTMTNEGGSRAEGNGFGGFTMFFLDDQGEKKTAVFIRRHGREIADHERGAINICILYHELGHVDDFEQGLHLIPDHPLDVVQAERHAHEYACAQLAARDYLLSLACWLAALRYGLSHCGVPNVEAAARAVVQSSLYEGYVRRVGGMETVDCFKETFDRSTANIEE